LPDDIIEILNPEYRSMELPHLISNILSAVRVIGNTMRDGGYSTEKVGSMNSFGDFQLDVDLKTDEVVFDSLRRSGLVNIASSEETPVEVNCMIQARGTGPGFSVAFDPLDGSSIIDANLTVGSIFGIWPGSGFHNRSGEEQCSSLVALYGPRVTAVLAFNNAATLDGKKICLELTMFPDRWIVTKPVFSISPKAKTFAPGNLRATSDNAAYRELVSYWIEKKFTLRYSGGLVPDIYHILVKGEGVLSNASSATAKAKLRLLYECAPIALIIECAGGSSCACASEAGESITPGSILNIPISDLDKRIGICVGSADEVQRFIGLIFKASI